MLDVTATFQEKHGFETRLLGWTEKGTFPGGHIPSPKGYNDRMRKYLESTKALPSITPKVCPFSTQTTVHPISGGTTVKRTAQEACLLV